MELEKPVLHHGPYEILYMVECQWDVNVNVYACIFGGISLKRAEIKYATHKPETYEENR